MRSSIGAKIFGLAVLLLALNFILAAFLLSRVFRLDEELRVIAERDMPLDTALSRLNDAGMRRRLAFEHWVAALRSQPPDKEEAAAAEREHGKNTALVEELLETARGLLRDYPRVTVDVASLAEIEVLISQLKQEYPEVVRQQHEMIELLHADRKSVV